MPGGARSRTTCDRPTTQVPDQRAHAVDGSTVAIRRHHDRNGAQRDDVGRLVTTCRHVIESRHNRIQIAIHMLSSAPRSTATKKRLIVKKFAIALIATFAIAGCATGGTEEADALQSRLSDLESQVEAAANAADRAASAATRASQEASAAQSAAQRAMDAANQANERAQRISDTCCARK